MKSSASNLSLKGKKKIWKEYEKYNKLDIKIWEWVVKMKKMRKKMVWNVMTWWRIFSSYIDGEMNCISYLEKKILKKKCSGSWLVLLSSKGENSIFLLGLKKFLRFFHFFFIKWKLKSILIILKCVVLCTQLNRNIRIRTFFLGDNQMV